jgi:hypothetical protein
MRFHRIGFAVAATVALAIGLLAQPPAGGGGGGKGKGKGGAPAVAVPANARAQAPIDLSGYWVSLVTEDWVYRMTIPPKDAKGKADVASVPVTPAARAAADAWDPAKDEAAGNTCKAYGAAGLMRIPTHLNIDWADDNTLRIQTTAGTQTRLFHFTGAAEGPASLQGFSKASWDGVATGRGRGAFGIPAGLTGDPDAPNGRAVQAPVRPGALKVVTTNLSGGYLRRNGIPYSANAVLTEYYDLLHNPDGSLYLVISTQVEDPANLTQIFRTSTHFKKEADGSMFKPTPCSVR